MKRISSLHLGVLLFICSLTLFFGLGRIAFVGPDEPRYAEIAREMWVHSDYVSPRLAGKLWLEKAPLLYWGQALFYSILGVNELAARLPSACGALFVVLSVWATSRRGLGQRSAFYVGVVASTMIAIVVFAHAGSTDMTLCTTLCGALVCLWRATQSEKRGLLWMLGAGAFAGGSMLAKGLIGPLLIALIFGLWCLWARPAIKGTKAQKFAAAGASLVVFFAVSATWYAPIWLKYGEFFWTEFFVNQHFKRFTSNEYNHPQPFYFYLVIAPLCTLPWMLWFFAALRDLPTLKPRLNQRDSLLAFAWVWALVPIAFFSLSGSKLPSYILPSFPALAILVGEALSRGIFLPRAWKPKWVAAGGTAFIIAFSLVAFLIYAPRNEEKLSTRTLCLQVAKQMKPGELATLLRLPKDYEPVFYLQGRMVTGQGKRDIFFAQDVSELVPLLQKGSLIVFANHREAPLLENNPSFTQQFIAKDRKLTAYRLTKR
jgi:4-amino-4-deoxy-L-arabinose transferase-like glycosyltransferase